MIEVTPNLKQVMASSRSIWGRSPCSRLTERPLEASSAWTCKHIPVRDRERNALTAF